jgi:hypothetical protein
MLLKKVWHQTEKHLSRFPGRTRNIRERTYLHFQGYLRWRGRKAKGGLESGLRRGLVVSSWNQWVAANGGDKTATVEDVKISFLTCYLEGYRYLLCRDSADEVEEKRRRQSLLEDLRGWEPGSRSADRYHRRIGDWREMAERFLCELYSLRQAADAIRQRYFEGHQVLFPARAGDFARLVGCIEELVEEYNEDFANGLEKLTGSSQEGLQTAKPPNSIDTAALEKDVTPGARRHTVFLMDMAKAEALDAMGETEKAVQLVERHV